MTDLIQEAAEWLQTEVKFDSLAQSVRYTTTAGTYVDVAATLGESEEEIHGDGLSLTIRRATWTIRKAGLVIGGTQHVPVRGETITWTSPAGEVLTFESTGTAEDPVNDSDRYRFVWVIRTVVTGVA